MSGLVTALTLASEVTALVALGVLTVRLARNLRFLATLLPHRAPSFPPPRVSVLVPARDEAPTISACVSSLLAQEYPDFEVLVLDDASTDSTPEQLDALAAHTPRLRVIHSDEEPPPGWNGKSYACARLAEQATGEWLLFTDADTVHQPESVARGVAQAQARGAALLSAFPFQTTPTWSERTLVPFLLDFLPLVALDYPALADGKPVAMAANGQYLLVRAQAYRDAGGHAAIASALVDDFALAALLRRHGHGITLTGGREFLSCRMYGGLRTVWNGFSKNVAGGLQMAGASHGRVAGWQVALFLWVYASVFFVPFAAVLQRPLAWPAVLCIVWLLALRAAVTWHLRRNPLEVPLTPLAAWLVTAITLHSTVSSRVRRVMWKGRAYSRAS